MDDWSSPSGEVRVEAAGLYIEGEYLAGNVPQPVAPDDTPETGEEGKAP